jgi:orotidine-5'-phosphate decarboxylase
MEAGATVPTIAFADKLAEAVERKRSQLVVGLDPQLELLPVELRGEERAADAFVRFCRGIIDATATHAVAVKPQSAFFEALGADGVRAFEEVCAYAKEVGLLVIADVKRGDVASTARAYAAAYLESGRADAITVSPYLGRDSIEPFLSACRRHGTGLFCLVKTSNAGGDVQDLVLSDGRPLWHEIARLVAEWGEELVGDRGLSSVGAVVGATHPRAVREARKLMPQSIFLILGVGAQGARPADLERAFTSGPASAIVSASRSVIYAYRETGGDFRAAAGAEASRLRREIWSVSGW